MRNDAEKLRLLADWFDNRDDNPDTEVQEDLRRIAKTLECKSVTPPDYVGGGEDEYPFGVEWNEDENTCILGIEGGHVEWTWFKENKIHDEKTWIDPTVKMMEKKLEWWEERGTEFISHIFTAVVDDNLEPAKALARRIQQNYEEDYTDYLDSCTGMTQDERDNLG